MRVQRGTHFLPARPTVSKIRSLTANPDSFRIRCTRLIKLALRSPSRRSSGVHRRIDRGEEPRRPPEP